MLIEFFTWWYGEGWLEAWRGVPRWIYKIRRTFSVPILLRTLFSPWRQIVSLAGRSLDEKLRAALDNLISRTIGFFVRLGTLIAAAVLTAMAAVAALALAASWPFIPVAILYCLYRSIAG